MTTPSTSLLPRLTLVEWAPVLFCWITLWYFFLNVIGVYRDEIAVDPLPILVGCIVIPFVIVAIHMTGRVESALVQLRNEASVEGGDEANSMPRLFKDLEMTVRRFEIGGAGAIAMLCAVITAVAISAKHTPGQGDGNWITNFLWPVMIGVGGFLGYILGRLVAYGNIIGFLEKRGFRLAGLATLGAREAMRSVGGVFGFAIAATTTICAWCAFWWLIWHAGWDEAFGAYRILWQTGYLGFWAAAFVLFLLCGWRPVRSFNQRLDRIYGGADARRSVDEMLRQAREDLAALDKAPQAQRDIDEHELRMFIETLQSRSFRSPLTSESVCIVLAALNLVLFVAPVIFGERLPGGL